MRNVLAFVLADALIVMQIGVMYFYFKYGLSCGRII